MPADLSKECIHKVIGPISFITNPYQRKESKQIVTLIYHAELTNLQDWFVIIQ